MQLGNATGGLNRDVNDFQKQEGSYSFALNATVENYSEDQSYPFLGNTPSNVHCLEWAPNEQVIGKIQIPELNTSVFAVYNTVTKAQLFYRETFTKNHLGEGDSYSVANCEVTLQPITQMFNCDKHLLFGTTCFKWDINHPVDFEYKLTDCTINLYFFNGLDDDRFIYFNEDWSVQDPFKVSLTNNDCAPNLLEQVDCKKTLWYPEIAYPCISTKVVSGGNKLPGKYSYLFSFATYDGTPLGTYKALTQGTSIFRRGKTDSNKSINVTISNITTTSRYRYYNLVAAQTVKGATTYKLVGTYSVNQTTVIDSDNTGTAISLQEILTQYPYYMNSGDVTISNNILFKTNVREYPKMNLQNIISQIKLKWVTTVLKEGDYAKPEVSEDYRSFLRDEIYPLGFEFVTTNGETIASGVLVGRAAQPGDLNPITNADVVKEDSCDVLNKPYWKVYNTATREFRDSRTPETIYNTCSIGDTIYERGEFAYWESTEVYPNNPFVWGNLCGKPIRHFKFPDHIQTLHHSTTTGSANYIFPLGVEVQTDIDQLLNNSVSNGAITLEQRNRIAGWRLIRGNRINNRSVIAKGLLYHVWEYERQSLDPNFGVCTPNSGVNTIIDSSIWVNTGGTYCLNGNLYQNQTDQFGATRVNLVAANDPSCGVGATFGAIASTTNVFGVAHGAGGHHFVPLSVQMFNYAVGSRLFVSVSGDVSIPFIEATSSPSFSFKLAHSNCCGAPGCGNIVTMQERASDGTTVLNTVVSGLIELCPPGSLASNQNPEILTCGALPGSTSIQVKSVPAIAGYTINAYLDGDSTYTSVASAITDSNGLATLTFTTTTGQTYWVSQSGNGLLESFSNSVTINGGCTNLLLNANFVCGSGSGTLTFAPTGGSGSYKYSLNNNDLNYFALVPITLTNGSHTVYVRDDNDFDYKVMYSITVNC
jgi:hypothetical protein